MKAIKIFFSILGVTLATISFGQLVSHYEPTKESDLVLSKYLDYSADLLFYSTEYNEENGKVTHWVSHLPDDNFGDVSYTDFESSIVSRTYFAKKIGMAYESVPVVEEWMTVPFEHGYFEPDVNLESWMGVPFESHWDEEDLEIEAWMTIAWM